MVLLRSRRVFEHHCGSCACVKIMLRQIASCDKGQHGPGGIFYVVV